MLQAPRRAASLALVFGLATFAGGLAEASPYYNVTDVTGETPGKDFAFPIPQLTAWPVTDTSGLPGVWGSDGVVDPRWVFLPMEVHGENKEGTLVGGVPNGMSHGEPYSFLTMGVALKSADGTYPAFSALAYWPPSPSAVAPSISLNNLNQVLVEGTLSTAQLVDLNTNVTTAISQLIPPDLLKQYSDIAAVSLSDNGSILLSAFDSNDSIGLQQRTLLLTPPDLPLPTPEPSSLTILAVAIGGLAWTRHRRLRRARSAGPNSTMPV